MFDRIRARREHRASQRVMDELLQFPHPEPPMPDYPEVGCEPDRAGSPLAPTVPVVDDLLPPDLRLPTRDEIAGMMMRWDTPLVIGGEIRACPQCGAYRNWVLLSIHDQVWLRCRAGHETLEPALDTAWYNRASGPMDRWHPTLEDGLKHLGH